MIIRLAWRNLWRNSRRTLLTMSAMAIASGLCILSLGIYEAMFRDVIDGSTGRFLGHARIMTAEYERTGKTIHSFSEKLTVEGSEADPVILIDKLRSLPGTVAVAGRVRGYLLLQNGEGDEVRAHPAEVLGISTDEERSVSTFESDLISGTFLGSQDSIVLGTGLARLMNATVGDEIAAIGQAADGSLAAELFTLSGIVDLKDPTKNRNLALVRREMLQGALAIRDHLHEIVVKLETPSIAAQWSDQLARPLVSSEMKVVSWMESLPMISRAMDIWVVIQLFMTGIIYSAVILATVNTLLMALMERKMEYAVVRALGMSPYFLAGIIVTEALLMSLLAGIAGLMIGGIGILAMQIIRPDISRFIGAIEYGGAVLQPRLNADMTFMNTGMPFSMLIILAGIVALYPAWKAMRMDLGTTLRSRE